MRTFTLRSSILVKGLFFVSLFTFHFSFSNAQIITTVAGNGFDHGTGNGAYSGDGGQATAAEIFGPAGVTFDASGNMYIGDYVNDRIRKVNASGVISTFAGNGFNSGSFAGGYTGNGGQATAAELNQPCGPIFDASGNAYIPDFGNNVIRKVNTSGIITTVVGNGF